MPSLNPDSLLVGDSAAMVDIRQLIRRITSSDVPVLITGPSGAGKEVVAREIHATSRRATGPFVPLNCGAIPRDLLETELFGHEKGAFTGAIATREGRFELARGGTLFLDEIGDMPLDMQVKLLRVLQEKRFERVGGNRSIDTDIRIIAATHRDLELSIGEGSFREDLYYRLNVFPIAVPPLRERREDIPALVAHLLDALAREEGLALNLNAAALAALQRYAWPGNVRELANLLERLALLTEGGSVTVADLPEKIRGAEWTPTPVAAPASPYPEVGEAGLDLKAVMAEMECELIRQALVRADGVVSGAARLLKLRRTTLIEKMRKYNIGH